MPLKFNESTKMLYYVYQIPLSLFVHNNWGLGSRLLPTKQCEGGGGLHVVLFTIDKSKNTIN